MKYIVLDSNIILLDAQNLLNIGGKTTAIVLPETVLEEVDSKKSGFSEISYQARNFGRLMASGISVTTNRTEEAIETSMVVNGKQVIVVTLNNYDIDTAKDSKNDQKIIKVAEYINNKYGNTILMTNDVLMRLRGFAVGVNIIDLKTTDKDDYCFVKSLKISDIDVFRSLHGAKINEIDSTYSFENFNYKFYYEGQVKLGTISNGVISIIGKETEKELRKQDIIPINAEQLFLSKAIQDSYVDVVVCESLAGSGKTLVAVSNAIKLVRKKKYEGVLYIRASINDVDKNEEVGFLPGAQEKFDVYLHPLYDSINLIARNRIKGNKLKPVELEAKIEELSHKIELECNITATTTLGMRGRTYNNMVIIIDEVQNQSKSSLVKVLTRIGKDCKVILIGSNRQIDNAYITKYNNGLSSIIASCSEEQKEIVLHAVTLKKVVRSKTADWAENLFSAAKEVN